MNETNDDVLQLSGDMIEIKISPEVRAVLLAIHESSRLEAEAERARVAAVKPFSVARMMRYMREWSNLTAVWKTQSDDGATYFTARDWSGSERLEVKVDTAGYIVDDTYFADVWSRPAGGTEDEWQNIDSIPKNLHPGTSLEIKTE